MVAHVDIEKVSVKKDRGILYISPGRSIVALRFYFIAAAIMVLWIICKVVVWIF